MCLFERDVLQALVCLNAFTGFDREAQERRSVAEERLLFTHQRCLVFAIFGEFQSIGNTLVIYFFVQIIVPLAVFCIIRGGLLISYRITAALSLPLLPTGWRSEAIQCLG